MYILDGLPFQPHRTAVEVVGILNIRPIFLVPRLLTKLLAHQTFFLVGNAAVAHVIMSPQRSLGLSKEISQSERVLVGTDVNQPAWSSGRTFRVSGAGQWKKNGYLVAISTGQASASSFTFLSYKITMSVLDQIKQYTTIVADSGDFESKYTAAAVVRPKVAPGN